MKVKAALLCEAQIKLQWVSAFCCQLIKAEVAPYPWKRWWRTAHVQILIVHMAVQHVQIYNWFAPFFFSFREIQSMRKRQKRSHFRILFRDKTCIYSNLSSVVYVVSFILGRIFTTYDRELKPAMTWIERRSKFGRCYFTAVVVLTGQTRTVHFWDDRNSPIFETGALRA